MVTRLSVEEAKANLTEVLSRVRQGDRAEIVDADGTALAVMVSPRDFERYEEGTRRDFFDIVADIHARNRDVDPDEVLRDVTVVVEEIRKSRRERGH
jgi:prevent-host-death family protein